MKRIILYFFLSFFLFFLIPFKALADSGKTEAIWTKDRLDEEITIINDQYRSDLESYRYKEKQYQISYDQHQTLQTLASIEDLLQKSKDLGLSRDQLLINYLNLLKLNLISTEGIELSLKDLYLERIEIVIKYLGDHQSFLANLSEKDEIRQSLESFTYTHKNISNFTNEILILLSIGKLQMVFDKSEILKLDIDQYLKEESALENAELIRASEETGRFIESSKLNLSELWQDIIDKSQNKQSFASLYKNLSRDLDPIYISLSQLLSYLGELLSI